ncbi:polysaccharide export outer membrane protein [Chitinasiproducens palmae]|uniref:Polysaccharide export outer membrane protein n=2 Tax=Chitinasiproducens palmae TaxID=1770053 RepID=A0A1H2PRA9_9BURK|nr:polysaccharide export outer membrane protein [Chitinasiproducens palmae]
MPDGTVVNFIPLDTAVLATLPRYSAPPADTLAPNSGPYVYKVGRGDVLRITIWDHPELNNPGIGSAPSTGTTAADIAVATGSNDPLGRIVASDGTIYFPFVGTVKVAGMSATQIRSLLTRRLSTYIRNPQLDVSISSYRSQRLYASGEVVHPGVATLGEVPITITDLISSAGGVTTNADLYRATLTRDGKQIPIDLYALLHYGDMRQNYELRADDRINIPDNRYNKVFVLGEVAKPTSIVIPKGDYSLAEALSDSGGLNQVTSNASQVYVVRRAEDGLTNAYILNAKAPTALALADQFELQPRDVVFVDPSGITRFARVITQVAPFLSGTNSAVNTVNATR